MEFSPLFYHRLVRPQRITKKYIHDLFQNYVDFNGKTVLDFGSGTGANCCLFKPGLYLGIDPDNNRIEFAKRKYPMYRFQTFDSQHMPVADRTIDVILIIAVLHHISSKVISDYIEEFHRVLRPRGIIIVLEPCLQKNSPLNNRFMKCFDRGRHIRYEEGYLQLFQSHQFDCTVLKRFRKCLLYNELLFFAKAD